MNFEEYQDVAGTFVAFDKDNPFNYLLPALAEEVGEFQGIFAKNFRKHGDYILSDEKLEQAFDELGDILWNVAMVAEFLGYPLKWVAEDNLKKLQERKETSTIVERSSSVGE